jgi:hypothetical protein
MAANAPTRRLETELAASLCLRAQIEPGLPEPADRQILEDMPGREDAKNAPLEILARIGRRAQGSPIRLAPR